MTQLRPDDFWYALPGLRLRSGQPAAPDPVGTIGPNPYGSVPRMVADPYARTVYPYAVNDKGEPELDQSGRPVRLDKPVVETIAFPDERDAAPPQDRQGASSQAELWQRVAQSTPISQVRNVFPAAGGRDGSLRQFDVAEVGDNHARGYGFFTQDDAARAALLAANPQSIRSNREYGGLVYRDVSDMFDYTGPVEGEADVVDPYDAPPPRGNEPVLGDYHTHSAYSIVDPKTNKIVRTDDPKRDSFNSDNFSRHDLAGIKQDAKGRPGFNGGWPGYKGYLGTPSGVFKVYDPATGKEYILP